MNVHRRNLPVSWLTPMVPILAIALAAGCCQSTNSSATMTWNGRQWTVDGFFKQMFARVPVLYASRDLCCRSEEELLRVATTRISIEPGVCPPGCDASHWRYAVLGFADGIGSLTNTVDAASWQITESDWAFTCSRSKGEKLVYDGGCDVAGEVVAIYLEPLDAPSNRIVKLVFELAEPEPDRHLWQLDCREASLVSREDLNIVRQDVDNRPQS